MSGHGFGYGFMRGRRRAPGGGGPTPAPSPALPAQAQIVGHFDAGAIVPQAGLHLVGNRITGAAIAGAGGVTALPEPMRDFECQAAGAEENQTHAPFRRGPVQRETQAELGAW